LLLEGTTGIEVELVGPLVVEGAGVDDDAAVETADVGTAVVV